jgi:ribosomal protein S12 methylthiotransferase accessory factor
MTSAPVDAERQALARLNRFIGKRTGLVKEPFPSFLSSHLPDIFVFSASTMGSGAALTEQEALVCAIGESVERHVSVSYEPEDDIVCSYNDLGDQAIAPSRFALYSETQYGQENFPYARFTQETPVRWTTAYSLLGKREVKVPSCLSYMSYRPEPGETVIGGASSNGLACHSSREQALLKGIYEIVERDAFFAVWLNRLSMPKLALDPSSWLGRVFDEKLAKPGIEYHFIDMTTDIAIPVACCVGKMKHGDKILTGVGAAANLDPSKALFKAMVEAGHTLIWADNMMSRDDWVLDPSFSNIRDFTDHVRLFCEPRMQPELDFLIASESVTDVSRLEDRSSDSLVRDIETCLRLLESRGLDAIMIDMTPSYVADAGLSVIKVFVPEAVGINGDHRYRFLGGDRLYEIPMFLRYTPARTTEAGLNPTPHPFP